jgi:hypothetical protein
VDGRPGKIDEHGTQGRGSLTVGMSTIQDIDREAARRVARVLGEDADAEAPGSDGGSGDAVPSPSSQHAATMDEARTKAKHTSRVVGRAWPHVPRILALAAVVAAILGLLQIAGNSKHGRNRTGSLRQSGPVDPDNPQGVPVMKNTIQRQAMTAAVTAAVGAAANAQQAVQWRVEDGGNGHWYQVVVANGDGILWDDAQAMAEAKGAHLATLTNEQEWAFTFPLVSGRMTLLGAYRDEGPGALHQGWRWITGEPWGYTRWFSGEPNGCDWSMCAGGLVLNQSWCLQSASSWNDAARLTQFGMSCGSPPQWLIEWSADCNNDGIVDYGQILSGQLADADTNGVPDTCECPCDVFRDNAVNGIDLGVLLGQWGEVTQYTVTDFNRDGAVDGSDLGQLLAAWGPCPS